MALEHHVAAALAGVVDRPRLYDVLNSRLMRVCIAQGPSGCGKTTLLRSWALQRTQGEQVIWVSLSGEAASREAFWEQLAVSAFRAGDLSDATMVQIREQLSVAARPGADRQRPAGRRRPGGDRAGRLRAPGGGDGPDRPRSGPAAGGGARAAVADLHPRRHPAGGPGVGRRLDRPGDPAQRARLTPEEIRLLIADQAGIDDERLAGSIGRATRGFALTVRAVVLTLSQLGTIPPIGSAEWNAVLAARLESLLPDEAAVQFVTDTSVPPYVDLELSRLLSGNPDDSDLLEMLERNGFGRWIPYARQRPVFQYVETIRETFRARAAADPERFRRSCVTSASWLLKNEEAVDQALQFAIDGGDYALADRIFLAVVIGNPASYMSDRFLAPLRKVPEEVLPEHPLLAFGLALALLSNGMLRGEAPRIAEIAISSTAQPVYVEPTVDAFSLAAMRAVTLRLTGRP